MGLTDQLRRLLHEPPAQTAMVHAGVIFASAGMLVLSLPSGAGEIAMWIVILLGFSLLRVLTVGKTLAASTLVLEPVGVAVFLAGTGGPGSPFFTLALAGIWWASRVANNQTAHVYRIDRRSGPLRLQLSAVIEAAPARRVWLMYGLALVGAYLLLVLPQAARTGTAGDAVQDALVMIGVSVLSEALRRRQTSAAGESAAVHSFSIGSEPADIRAGLARALRTNEVPVDAVLAAGQAGLTALQAELLPYLVLGLTNLEIADAIQVSEATVRYRLTRLYRALSVSGRAQAADRARELGLTGNPLNVQSTRSA
jgi:DNA-binding CsgD family transcriptional regulator